MNIRASHCSKIVQDFVRDRCVLGPDEYQPFVDLWDAFQSWQEANPDITKQAMGRALTAMGISRDTAWVDGKMAKMRVGIRLKA